MMAPPKVVASPSSSMRGSAYQLKHAASLPSTHERRQLHLHNSISDRSSSEARTGQAKHSIKTQATTAIAPPSASDHTSWLERLPLRQQLSPPVNASRLVDTNTVFVEQHRIRGYEVGPDRQATILTIANLLQECGSNHAVCIWGRTEAGFSSCPEMVENKQIFAVTRLQIQMDTYPAWGDVVQLSSWIHDDTRLTVSRDWSLTDANTGAVFGNCTSTWVVVNMETRRLNKLPPSMHAMIQRFKPDAPRFAVPPAEAKRKIPEVEEPFDIVGPVQVARRSDMDMNGHINNVTYLAWTLETVPEDVFAHGKLCQGMLRATTNTNTREHTMMRVYHEYHEFPQIELDYKHECQAGDTVESGAMRVPPEEVTYCPEGRSVVQFVHMLRRCDEHGCTELVRARTTWVME